MHSDVRLEIEEFLYREARLLDGRRFHEWLELLTDDARYWMPARTTRYSKKSKAIDIRERDKYDDSELSKEGELAYFDETKQTLEMRVARLETGMARAEEPPSRIRRFVGNVEVEPSGKESEIKVFSNFILYRSRLETEQDLYVGGREDLLRRAGGGWKIAYRKIILDQNVVVAKNMSMFF